MKHHALSAVAVALFSPVAAAQHIDVLAFENNGRVAVGEFNLDEFAASEERVFTARFDSFYAVNSPGVFARAGDLPGRSDLLWDFLPLTVDAGVHEGHTSTLLYWDTDAFDEPTFGPPPAEHSLTLFGVGGTEGVADGGESIAPGGVIETTAANGSIHQHNFFFLDDNGDGESTTPPAPGVYVIAMSLWMESLEPSEPIFFVWATPEISVLPAIRPAAAWVEQRVDTLFVDPNFLPGDFNVDGVVDAADYTVWRDNAGGSFAPADYDAWRDHFGATADAATTSVPEPTGVALATLLGVVASSVRSRLPA